jgi:TonB family protein
MSSISREPVASGFSRKIRWHYPPDWITIIDVRRSNTARRTTRGLEVFMIGPFFAILVTQAVVSAPVAPQSTAPQQPAAIQEATAQPWPPAGVARIGGGVVSPAILKEAKPRYTAEAMKAKIQGWVEVEAVIETDGTVGEVRVTKSLDKQYGLDDEAVKAVKAWLFKPGTKDGVAVPVLVKIEMSFALRDKR